MTQDVLFTEDKYPTLKLCTSCNNRKPLSDFYVQYNRLRNGTKSLTHSGRCKTCYTISYNGLRQSGVEISLDTYNDLLLKQNNKCAICGYDETALANNQIKIRRLSVDHDHQTNKIRGLLCKNCNSAIGLFKDNPDIILSAYRYLKSDV